MFTCHKCGGLLASDKTENTDGLFGCRCMSGYVREWQESKNRSEAIAAQIEKTRMWIDLYKRQGRTQDKIDYEQNRLDELLKLKV